MALDKQKRDFLAEVLGEDKAAEIDETLDGLSKEAADQGLEFKDAEEGEQPEIEAKDAETPEPEPQPEPVKYVTEADVAAAVGLVVGEVQGSLSALQAQVEELAGHYKTLTDALASLERSDEEKIKDLIDMTPGASLAAQIQSVIGQKATQLNKGDKLAKQKPQEAPTSAEGRFPASILDKFYDAAWKQ